MTRERARRGFVLCDWSPEDENRFLTIMAAALPGKKQRAFELACQLFPRVWRAYNPKFKDQLNA